jgi:hypothetical protein
MSFIVRSVHRRALVASTAVALVAAGFLGARPSPRAQHRPEQTGNGTGIASTNLA